MKCIFFISAFGRYLWKAASNTVKENKEYLLLYSFILPYIYIWLICAARILHILMLLLSRLKKQWKNELIHGVLKHFS